MAGFMNIETVVISSRDVVVVAVAALHYCLNTDGRQL